MSHRSGRSRGTDPAITAFDPGINKTVMSHERLAVLSAFGTKNTGGDRHISNHPYINGFRRYLFFFRGFRISDDLEKYSLGLQASIIIDQHDIVIEKSVNRLSVPELESLIPGLFHSYDFGADMG